jgi:hypothetical protein
MDNRLLPPSQRAAAKAEKEATVTETALKQKDILIRAMRTVFNTPEGLIVLAWLYDECGANKPILGAMGGAIDEKATLYQAMRLNLWLKIRTMLNFNILKEVEYEPDQI